MIHSINIISSFIDQICDPSPKIFPNKIDRKNRFRRNQNFFFKQLIFLTVLLIYTFFIKERATLVNYWYIGIYLISFTVFCFLGRSHPRYFRILYVILMIGSGPTVLYLDKNSVIDCWTNTFIIPVLVQFDSNSHITYMFEVGIQLLFMIAYYKEKMMDLMDETSSKAFVNQLMAATIYAIVINLISSYSIRTMLMNSYKKELTLIENKRQELVVQKTFILSFSHEIRNLINTLSGNIQLSLLEKIPLKVKNYLEDAEIGAGLLLQLINNVLDSGNLDLGELNINQTNQGIHGTLEKMWKICGYLLKTKNLNGQFRIRKNLPQNLKLDHDRFVQILINLTVNAAKFTNQGLVDVKLEWIPNAATVTDEHYYPSPFDDENEGLFEKDQALSLLGGDFAFIGIDKRKWSPHRYNILQGTGPGLLKVTVTDTGCGMMADNLPYAFDKFSSQIFGDNASKRLGTTIGLYVTRELCKRMGGDIKIFSKVDRGTSFIAYIPAEQLPPNRELRRNLSFEAQQLRQLKAMIVDDMHFNIVVLTSYLQRMKLDVVNTAIDGLDAFNKYVDSVRKGTRPDVITMDVEMPVMDGKEAAMKIREYEKEHKLEPCFLVMVSGNVCESEISQCLRYSGGVLANHFLKKPAVFDDVFRIINEHFLIENPNNI